MGQEQSRNPTSFFSVVGSKKKKKAGPGRYIAADPYS